MNLIDINIPKLVDKNNRKLNKVLQTIFFEKEFIPYTKRQYIDCEKIRKKCPIQVSYTYIRAILNALYVFDIIKLDYKGAFIIELEIPKYIRNRFKSSIIIANKNQELEKVQECSSEVEKSQEIIPEVENVVEPELEKVQECSSEVEKSQEIIPEVENVIEPQQKRFLNPDYLTPEEVGLSIIAGTYVLKNENDTIKEELLILQKDLQQKEKDIKILQTQIKILQSQVKTDVNKRNSQNSSNHVSLKEFHPPIKEN